MQKKLTTATLLASFNMLNTKFE